MVGFWSNSHWSVAFDNPDRPKDARITKEPCGCLQCRRVYLAIGRARWNGTRATVTSYVIDLLDRMGAGAARHHHREGSVAVPDRGRRLLYP